MSAAAFHADIVEQLAQVFRAPPIVTGKLDPLVSHLRNGSDRSNEVFGAFIADGIELQADGNLVSAIAFGREARGRHDTGHGSSRAHFGEKTPSGKSWIGHVNGITRSGSGVKPTTSLAGIFSANDPKGVGIEDRFTTRGAEFA